MIDLASTLHGFRTAFPPGDIYPQSFFTVTNVANSSGADQVGILDTYLRLGILGLFYALMMQLTLNARGFGSGVQILFG